MIVSAAVQSNALQVSFENVQFDEFREHVCWVCSPMNLCDPEDSGPDQVLHEQVPELNVTSFP